MRMFDIIKKKKNSQVLSKDEIDFVVRGYTSGTVGDGQMAALLMAICLNGLDRGETSALTMAMANSGEILDLRDLGLAVDKHSTGGVGDKLTLTVAPMAAACGLVMAKMSGKSLGHTGGTIDKLASIPGFRTELDPAEFRALLGRVGVCIASQSANLAPADKAIYALRDLTATVDNISLIAASIMSKKIAAGAEVIVLDVKVGSGAFMKSLPEARELARIMVDIGKDCGRKMAAVVTAMDAPLGYAVGNGLEVSEAIRCLQGGGPDDIRVLSIELTAHILMLAKDINEDEARKMAADTLDNGAALAKFMEMAVAQGADEHFELELSAHRTGIHAPRAGYITAMDGEVCGHAAHICSNGNSDMTAGIVFQKKTGDYVEQGETVAYLLSNDPAALEQARALLETAYTLGDAKPADVPLVYEVIT